MTRVKYAAATIALSLAAVAGIAHAAPKPQGACTSTFRIYFAPGDASLNAPAREIISAASEDLSACAAPAPVVAFATSEQSDDSVNTRRKAAILSALHGTGVNASPINVVAAATQIAAVREDTPAYIQVSVAPTSQAAFAAVEDALPHTPVRRDPIPTS